MKKCAEQATEVVFFARAIERGFGECMRADGSRFAADFISGDPRRSLRAGFMRSLAGLFQKINHGNSQ